MERQHQIDLANYSFIHSYPLVNTCNTFRP